MLASTQAPPVSIAQSLLVSSKRSRMFGVKLSVWNLASSPHAAVLVLMEEARASLQALGSSLSKDARPSWWLLHLGEVQVS